MGRWLVAGLLVGLFAGGLLVPRWTAAGNQSAQIAALEQRVAALEHQSVLPGTIELACTSGFVEGHVLDAGSLGNVTRIRVTWQPKTTPANVNNPLLNKDVGRAVLQHCAVQASTP